VVAVVAVASAQTDWRRVGASAMESNLAGPVTGPMVSVWYAADGSFLYARTASGKTFQTQDFENWDPAPAGAPEPPKTFPREPVRKPEPAARYLAINANSQEMWGLGRQLYRSDDGKSWQSLTGYKSESVVGGRIHSVAVSPGDPNQVVVANEDGVWRSMDGGLTWASLNLLLPNLSVQRIVSTPSGGHSAKILTGLGALELVPGTTLWRPYPALSPQYDALKKQEYSGKVPAVVSAFAESSDGRWVYAGSEDGRIWVSVDGGASFPPNAALGAAAGHRVERLWVDPADKMVALAALSGEGSHVLRTYNGGISWDPLDSGLPAAAANSVTADQPSGAVYVATDKGVYWTQFSLEDAVQTTNLTWTNLSGRLPPQARAVDVALDPAGVQLYVALEGHGVFGAPAPHRATGLRLVNAADYSTRPAAPGSWVSILGEKVNSVTTGAQPLPLWSNSQIQVPFEAVGPTVSLALETASGTTTRDLQVLPVSPAIFVGADGVPLILDADSGMPLEGNVAHSGQRLQVLVNGLGKVRPDWPTGMEPPQENPPAVVARVQASLDGSEAPVARATLAPGYVGYYVVEVQLPPVANYGAMELYLTADGHESNRVQIVISQ
jgi:uncharacterized protein (TIGR03437 family)